MNLVVNCTEGGARIKGAKQMLLKDALNTYCKESIDKSAIKPLLSYADDGDELIEKVIPLLDKDIKNLENIVKNSRLGIASNKGLSNLLNRNKKKLINKKKENLFNRVSKQAFIDAGYNSVIANDLFYERILKEIKTHNKFFIPIIKLSKSNYMYSTAAHISSSQNPLVNVAIHGAHRQIQGRKLKVDETLVAFLNDKKIAQIRMDRNNLILSVAKKAAESLLKSYNKTLDILKKYNETKDDTILKMNINEEINLDDADKYFENGNWAHPYIDAKRYLETYKHLDYIKSHKDAKKIYNKALDMRNEAIEKAKKYEEENSKRESKVLKHNELIEESQKAGKEKDFDKALNLIKEALELTPDSEAAQWGLASVYNQLGKYKLSILEYHKLINMQDDNKPENPRYRFELGQVYLFNDQIKEGFEQISKAMDLTNEFDSFLAYMGDIHLKKGNYKEALLAYESYLEKFPYDFNVIKNKGNVLMSLNREIEAIECFDKANEIQGSK